MYRTITTVADVHHFNTDPDPAFRFNLNPDPAKMYRTTTVADPHHLNATPDFEPSHIH
jgi:hypothetical protein